MASFIENPSGPIAFVGGGGGTTVSPVTPAPAPFKPIVNDIKPWGPGSGSGSGSGSNPYNLPTQPSNPVNPVPWSFASDPSVQLALNMYQQALGNINAAYGINSQYGPAPYQADPWASANLSIEQVNALAALREQQARASAAQQIANANQDYNYQQGGLAHQLPITMLGISNALAAHGLGNSGDYNYQRGEAQWEYNNQVQGLANALQQSTSGANLSRDQAIAMAQMEASQNAAAQRMTATQQAAAEAQQMAAYNFAKDQAAQQAAYQKTTGTQSAQDALAQALLTAYQNAAKDPSLTLTSTGSSSIPPDILKLLGGSLGGTTSGPIIQGGPAPAVKA